MKKSLTAAMAALTFGGAVAATAVPAEARDYGHRYYRSYDRHHGSNTGAAVAAGVVGLALGAALASSSHNDRDYGYGYNRSYSYGRGYYDNGYGYYPRGGYVYERPYRVCESERWVYDPYIGRRVPMITRYAC